MATKRAARVLVVDDTPEIARRLADLLTESRAVESVETVTDGKAAIERFEQTRPDAVVLDLNMPGVHGLDVLRAIRATQAPCVVVVLSSHSEPALREQCLAEGADHVLHKGTETEHLLEIATSWQNDPTGPSGMS